VLADDFESATTETLPHGNAAEQRTSRWDRGWGGTKISDEPQHVHAGRRALELTTNGPGGGAIVKDMDRGYDRIFLRYYIRYDAAFSRPQFYPSGKTLPGANAARGLFGPSFVPRTDFVPARGRWYCYELMAQANTPGQRDGRVAFWVDGRLAADFPNLHFRTTDALKLNRAAFLIYETRNNGLHRVWIDDVVLATAYIGPMITDR